MDQCNSSEEAVSRGSLFPVHHRFGNILFSLWRGIPLWTFELAQFRHCFWKQPLGHMQTFLLCFSIVAVHQTLSQSSLCDHPFPSRRQHTHPRQLWPHCVYIRPQPGRQPQQKSRNYLQPYTRHFFFLKPSRYFLNHFLNRNWSLANFWDWNKSPHVSAWHKSAICSVCLFLLCFKMAPYKSITVHLEFVGLCFFLQLSMRNGIQGLWDLKERFLKTLHLS